MWRHVKNNARLLFAILAVGSCSSILVPSDSVYAATTNIQANICDQFLGPTISSPADDATIQASSVIVTGTGEPGMIVTIRINGQSAGSSTVLPDGSYALAVSLFENSNTITAREVNTCDTVKDSTAVVVNHPVDHPVPPSNGGSSEEPSSPLPLPSLPKPSSTLKAYYNMNDLYIKDIKLPSYFRPTIESPVNGNTTNNSSIWVAGSAIPGGVVTIYVNNQVAARVVASSIGKYYALVGLLSGENHIRVMSELGGQSAVSDAVHVTYLNKVEAADTTVSDDIIFNLLLVGIFGIAVVMSLLWYIPRPQNAIRRRDRKK